MNLDLIKRFPGWVLDLAQHPDDYITIMSNDYDSFFSCRFLRSMLGVPIGGYYDFTSGIFLTDEAAQSNRTPILIDVSCVLNGVLAFDNHFLLINNHMVANPNTLLSYADHCRYNQKFGGSTLLFLYSLFADHELNQKEKMLLMTVDGFYLGFVKKGGAYRDISEKWLDRLGMRDTLEQTIGDNDITDYKTFTENQCLNNRFLRSDDDCCLYEYSDSDSTLSALLLNDEKLCFPNRVLSVKQDYCTYAEMMVFLREEAQQPELGLFSAARTQSDRFIYSAITDNTKWRYSYEQTPAA